MEAKHKQSGITLMEMTVVVAAVALLAVLGLPAISAFFNSLVSKGPTEAMISAALSSARATAVKERHYAGIRFQKAYDPKGPLEADQYMVFIVHDVDKTGLANGFRAVEGIEPIKLPEAVGVMDLVVVDRVDVVANVPKITEVTIDNDSLIDEQLELTDATTFSIVFSPTGKLVIHRVRVRNRDEEVDGTGNVSGISSDDVFNKKDRVDAGEALLYQDDYYGSTWSPYFPDNFGLGPERSRNSFIIYERDKFKAAYEKGRAWSDYLQNLDAIYINPYVGTIIEK